MYWSSLRNNSYFCRYILNTMQKKWFYLFFTAGENVSEKKNQQADEKQPESSSFKVSSLTSELMSLKNSDKPDINKILEEYKKESRPYVLKPKYTSPSSLPLYFYFGYQLLQEQAAMEKSGHVSDEQITQVIYPPKNQMWCFTLYLSKNCLNVVCWNRSFSLCFLFQQNHGVIINQKN